MQINAMQDRCTFGNAGNGTEAPGAALFGAACRCRFHRKPKALNYCSFLNYLVFLESGCLVFFLF